MNDNLVNERASEVEASPASPSTESKILPEIDSQNLKSKEVMQLASQSSIANKLLFNLVIPVLLVGLGFGVIRMLGTVEAPTVPPRGDTKNDRMESLTSISVASVSSLEDLGAQLELSVDGAVVPYREVSLATEIAGRIIYKADDCEAGSVVTQGTILMRIDPTDYELEVERLTRQKEQSYEAIREVDQQSVNTRRLIQLAEQELKLQERELDRQRSMPKGFASQGEIDTAQRAVLQARQSLLSNENQLNLLARRRASAEAAERLATTQLKVAEVNLSRTEITAPIDGVIVREDAELNSFVNRGASIVTMEDTSKVEVAANLRMDQLYWLSTQEGRPTDDMQAGYKLPDTPAVIQYELAGRENTTYHWEARLIGFDGIGLNTETRTVPVRLLVDAPRKYTDHSGSLHESNGPTALVRGMFVKVTFKLRPQVPLIVVPEKAIKPGNRVWHYIPDDSVLDTSILTESEKEAIELNKNHASAKSDPSEASSPEGDKSETEEVFDSSNWGAGRVLVVQPIVPVDTLSPAYTPETKPGEAETTWWICEMPEGSLSSGSFVVLSPLGGIGPNGLPARAPREQLNASLGITATLHSSTTTSSQGSAE